MGLTSSEMSFYQHKGLIDLLAGSHEIAGRKLDLSQLALDSLHGNLYLDMYKVSTHQYPGLKKNKNIYQNITEDSLGNNITKIIGTKGDDYIAGGYLGEKIYGGKGNDVLVGRGGDDFLQGGHGNDILRPGKGTNTLDGEKGSDTAYFTFLTPIVTNNGTEDVAPVSLFDNAVDTSLFSDGDRTKLTQLLADHNDIGNINIDLWVRLNEGYAYSLSDTAVNTEGYDPRNPSEPTPIAEKTSFKSIENISVDAQHSAYGTTSADLKASKFFANTIIEGDGNANKLIGGKAKDWIFGHDGDDRIAGGSGEDTLYGGDGKDRIFGGKDSDEIFGDANDDILDGGGGNDTIYGGIGNDVIRGNWGRDVLYGEDGNDWLNGYNGDDTLYGGSGNDTLVGGKGVDGLDGGSGDDILVGGFGERDYLNGGEGNDTASYEGASQSVYISLDVASSPIDLAIAVVSNGAIINDGNTLFGIENLIGSDHDDWLVGDVADNILTGGRGDDILTGGQGADIFVIDSSGSDTITDFNLADGDMLRIEGSSLSQLRIGDNDDGNLFVLDSSSGTILVTLEGVDYASLEPNNTDILFEIL